MPTEVLILRLLHILGGTFWLGAGFFSAVFLMPSFAAARMNPGPLFAELERRRYFLLLPIVAVLTMLSGLRLLAITSGGFHEAYFATAQGLAYAIGGVSSLVAFAVSMLVSRPSNQRAAQLQATVPDLAGERLRDVQAEIATLRRRGGIATSVAVATLVLSGALMAVARYL